MMGNWDLMVLGVEAQAGGRFTRGEAAQFLQIVQAYPFRVEAGNLISKPDKASLADKGLIAPKYGDDFHLTDKGRELAVELRLLEAVEG